MSANAPAKLLRILKNQLGLRHLIGIQTVPTIMGDTRLSTLCQGLAKLPVGAQLDLLDLAARKRRRRPAAAPADLITAAMDEMNMTAR